LANNKTHQQHTLSDQTNRFPIINVRPPGCIAKWYRDRTHSHTNEDEACLRAREIKEGINDPENSLYQRFQLQPSSAGRGEYIHSIQLAILHLSNRLVIVEP